MMEKLWGDNFFDPATKKWTKKATNAATCKRGFVQFVYEPIKTIIDACMADNKVCASHALATLSLKLVQLLASHPLLTPVVCQALVSTLDQPAGYIGPSGRKIQRIAMPRCLVVSLCSPE